MGDSISEGTVAAVLKKAGEPVAMDEVVAQIETDKVTIDVRSPVGGAVTDVLVKEQDTVVVGQAVVRVEEGAAGMEPLLGGAAKANEGGGGGRQRQGRPRPRPLRPRPLRPPSPRLHPLPPPPPSPPLHLLPQPPQPPLPQPPPQAARAASAPSAASR